MLSNNLKYLRKKRNLSQQELSSDFDIPRTTLGDYERGKTEPNLATLIKISEYFDTPLDLLIKTKLSNNELEILNDNNLKILAISVDAESRGNIELVDTKAEAGYLESFQDPEYIRDLPKIAIPQLKDGTYRGFEIEGDSMLPIESGSIIISQYVESIAALKDEKTYIIVSKSEGLVYKRVRNDKENQRLILISDNPLYLPYTLDYREVQEIWQFHASLTFSDSPASYHQSIDAKLSEIKNKLEGIEEKIS